MVCIDSHKWGWCLAKAALMSAEALHLETGDRVYHAGVTFLKCGDNGDIF